MRIPYEQRYRLVLTPLASNWQESIVPLWKTVDQLLSRSPRARFIVCYQERAAATTEYLLRLAAEHHFAHAVIDGTPYLAHCSIPTHRDIKFFVFTRQSAQ
jgi:hypothetical protein